jgi:hypothetical protein
MCRIAVIDPDAVPVPRARPQPQSFVRSSVIICVIVSLKEPRGILWRISTTHRSSCYMYTACVYTSDTSDGFARFSYSDKCNHDARVMHAHGGMVTTSGVSKPGRLAEKHGTYVPSGVGCRVRPSMPSSNVGSCGTNRCQIQYQRRTLE